jgi:hypothetical protein
MTSLPLGIERPCREHGKTCVERWKMITAQSENRVQPRPFLPKLQPSGMALIISRNPEESSGIMDESSPLQGDWDSKFNNIIL